jgi:hypothetical protein
MVVKRESWRRLRDDACEISPIGAAGGKFLQKNT